MLDSAKCSCSRQWILVSSCPERRPRSDSRWAEQSQRPRRLLLQRPQCASFPLATWTVASDSTRLTWAQATMKTLCLSIRPALRSFVVEATQAWGWLSSVQVCAVEIPGADVAVACKCRLASSPCIWWKTNSLSWWQFKIKSNWMYLHGHKNWLTKPCQPVKAPAEKPELRKLKQKTRATEAQAESENQDCDSPCRKPELRKLKQNQKTGTASR